MDIKAAIRGAVQALVALLTTIPLVMALDIADELQLFLEALGYGVVILVMRALEERFPFLAKIFSLGVTATGPSYD